MIILAHRGASGHAPENTLLAFDKAIELGADWVELDVQLIDGRLVVFHDHRLERTTRGRGLLAHASAAALGSLDAGARQRIPVLTQVLDSVARRVGVNIELKGFGTAAPVAQTVREYIAGKGWRGDDFLASSFIHTELRRFRELMPEIPTGVLVMGVPLDVAAMCRDLNAHSLHASIEFIDRRLVDDAHGAGARVFVYTVNHADEVAWLQDLGVDGVFTDYPDRIRAALSARR